MIAAAKIRLALAHGASGQCRDLALAAAREAGVKAISDNRQLSPAISWPSPCKPPTRRLK